MSAFKSEPEGSRSYCAAWEREAFRLGRRSARDQVDARSPPRRGGRAPRLRRFDPRPPSRRRSPTLCRPEDQKLCHRSAKTWRIAVPMAAQLIVADETDRWGVELKPAEGPAAPTARSSVRGVRAFEPSFEPGAGSVAQIAADVVGRQAESGRAANHDMGEILANAAAARENLASGVVIWVAFDHRRNR